MALSVGDKLGPYEIVAPIGQGGMGAVYRARDTRLDRDVAIKVSQERFSDRFAREARTISSLNHPNICTLHDTGENYLVMELVEGQTLAERLKQKGPLPIADAVAIARQIADALEAAHEKDIVHRDLKPGNIIVRKDGSIKVLDFGLAKKVRDTSAGGQPDATQSLTLTEAGAVLGTGAYMSPEQVRGEDVDTQTDIWAFGCVLYQMLTGRSPFAQPTMQETLAKILEGEPDYGALPAGTPPSLVRLLRRCLAKNQRDRLHHIADARGELADVTEEAAPIATQKSTPRPMWVSGLGILVVLLLAVIVALLTTRDGDPAADAQIVRFSIGPVPNPGTPFVSREIAISDDGSQLAYVSGGKIWMRPMSATEAFPLADGWEPAFSPSGEWVAFLQRDMGLFKAPAAGGARILINPISAIGAEGRILGLTWLSEDTLVYANGTGLHVIPAEENSEPTALIPAPSDGVYAWPEVLPDGRLLASHIVTERPTDANEIVLVDPESKEVQAIHRGGVGPRYVETGDGGVLVYATGTGLAAIRFSPSQSAVQGSAVLIRDVSPTVRPPYRGATFDVSPKGTLVYFPAPDRYSNWLTWVDPTGNEERVRGSQLPGAIGDPRISPDGTRIVLEMDQGNGRHLWVIDTERGTSQQISDGPREEFLGYWTLDGKRVFYTSDEGGGYQIYSRAADGTGTGELVIDDPDVNMPMRHTEGNRLPFFSDNNGWDVGILSLDDPVDLKWLLTTNTRELNAMLSPDGNWLAYESNESGGRTEVYVRPFPDVDGRRVQVSVNGGGQPIWDPRGEDVLYFRSINEAGLLAGIMSQTVAFSPEFQVLGEPTELFPNNNYAQFAAWSYDISPRDGRFLFVQSPGDSAQGGTLVWVTLNWFGELTERLLDAQQ